MKILLLCVLIVVTGGTDGFHVLNSRDSYRETGQKVFLRKLQTFQRDDPVQTKTTSWNQILADALVDRIKIFSFNKVTSTELPKDVQAKNNILTDCISQMMLIYKTLIYDKFYKPTTSHPYNAVNSNRDSEHTELDKQNKELQNEDVDVLKTENAFEDPKYDVEVIEPRYHGKLCGDCDGYTEKIDKAENEASGTVENGEIAKPIVTDCPEGLAKTGDGRCADSKSKFILSIPYQCPIGYRRDWLGFCRPQL